MSDMESARKREAEQAAKFRANLLSALNEAMKVCEEAGGKWHSHWQAHNEQRQDGGSTFTLTIDPYK